jgi:hypothetical protein
LPCPTACAKRRDQVGNARDDDQQYVHSGDDKPGQQPEQHRRPPGQVVPHHGQRGHHHDEVDIRPHRQVEPDLRHLLNAGVGLLERLPYAVAQVKRPVAGHVGVDDLGVPAASVLDNGLGPERMRLTVLSQLFPGLARVQCG